VDLRDPSVREVLRRGRIEITGRLVDASNATLFGTVCADGVELRCVYKPVRGERPLWDFPDGTLAGREVASHLISETAGWHVVPPTLLRDGPFGPGMVQVWVDTNDERELVDVLPPKEVPPGWLGVLRARDGRGEPAVLVHADLPELRAMAVFDVVVNNADRKGGHVLAGVDGRIYGVDHGLCLHVEHKLRTVLWGWVGQQMTPRCSSRCAGCARRWTAAGRSATSWASTSPGARSARCGRGSRRSWRTPVFPNRRATVPRSPGRPSRLTR